MVSIHHLSGATSTISTMVPPTLMGGSPSVVPVDRSCLRPTERARPVAHSDGRRPQYVRAVKEYLPVNGGLRRIAPDARDQHREHVAFADLVADVRLRASGPR